MKVTKPRDKRWTSSPRKTANKLWLQIGLQKREDQCNHLLNQKLLLLNHQVKKVNFRFMVWPNITPGVKQMHLLLEEKHIIQVQIQNKQQISFTISISARPLTNSLPKKYILLNLKKFKKKSTKSNILLAKKRKKA